MLFDIPMNARFKTTKSGPKKKTSSGGKSPKGGKGAGGKGKEGAKRKPAGGVFAARIAAAQKRGKGAKRK